MQCNDTQGWLQFDCQRLLQNTQSSNKIESEVKVPIILQFIKNIKFNCNYETACNSKSNRNSLVITTTTTTTLLQLPLIEVGNAMRAYSYSTASYP